MWVFFILGVAIIILMFSWEVVWLKKKDQKSVEKLRAANLDFKRQIQSQPITGVYELYHFTSTGSQIVEENGKSYLQFSLGKAYIAPHLLEKLAECKKRMAKI
jgi:hypothetical protein